MPANILCPHCQREIPMSDAFDQAVRQAQSAELQETRERLQLAHEQERQLRIERRDLEDRQRELALTLQRTLDEERAKIREEAHRQADENHRLKEADRERLTANLRLQIDELKRKAELGIPSIQGETAEIDLEEFLRGQFPRDDIEPVPVGVHGGDVLQRVRDSSGQVCGTILYESKRTKSWQNAWLPKLRDDQMAARADLAVLVSAEMPKHLALFGQIDGLWIARRSCLEGLAVALRFGLIEVARTRRASEGPQTRADRVVAYLHGPSFRLKIEGVVAAYQTMKDALIDEKRWHQRDWAKREKQLDRAILTLSALVGDFDGLLGAALPSFDPLTTALIAVEENPSLETACAEASPF